MMRGLGADFPITNATVNFIAQGDCAYLSTGLLQLGPSMLELLFRSFMGIPPAGVTQQTFDAFTLRAIQCDLYSRPASPEGGAWIRQQAPILACMADDVQALITYQRAHGFAGSDPNMNAAAWLLTRDPSYHHDWLLTPPCPADCINSFRNDLIHRCMTDLSSPCSASPAMHDWYVDALGVPLCNNLAQAMITQYAGNCNDAPYCGEHWFLGPDGDTNYRCWALSAAGALEDYLAGCAPAPTPVPSPGPMPPAPSPAPAPAPETTPVTVGPAPIPSPGPMPPAPSPLPPAPSPLPPAPSPLPPAPSPLPPETTPMPVEQQPYQDVVPMPSPDVYAPPVEASTGPSRTALIAGAAAALLVVGGGVAYYATRKRRRR